MTVMRVAQVSHPDGPFELVERAVPEPGPGTVRIRVQACGICHGDVVMRSGHFPGSTFPRVPGHEVVGVIDALGPGVAGWTVGERVGVGWNGGSCHHCGPCRQGRLIACEHSPVTGIHVDGGYGEYLVASVSALARVPAGLPAVEAAPLMCAGLTTFNALRHSGARAGDVVAVHGLGGLGHLGVQYAKKMGFHTVAIARGADKGSFAHQLGADVYLDSQEQDVPAELQKLGGARVILTTVTSGAAMQAVLGGLGIDGTLLIVGADASMTVSPFWLIGGNRSVKGWASGTAADAEDTLAFSLRTGVRPLIEVFPLDQVDAAYEHMHEGRARFRAVLEIAE